MVLTIEVPERVVERAAELGVPVETLVARAVDGIAAEPAVDQHVAGDGEPLPAGFRWLRGDEPPAMTPEEATVGIRAIQSRHTLGGLKIKDLIEEGRRI